MTERQGQNDPARWTSHSAHPGQLRRPHHHRGDEQEHTVFYDPTSPLSAALGGKTYSLEHRASLVPRLPLESATS